MYSIIHQKATSQTKKIGIKIGPTEKPKKLQVHKSCIEILPFIENQTPQAFHKLALKLNEDIRSPLKGFGKLSLL